MADIRTLRKFLGEPSFRAMPHHTISPEKLLGCAVGASPGLRMMVDDGKLFNRKGLVKSLKGEGTKNVCWLVGELDGVRVYVQQDEDCMQIVMTRENLRP